MLIKYLQNEFGFNQAELNLIENKLKNIRIKFASESIVDRINYYKYTCGWTNEELKKVIKTHPIILCRDLDSVRAKVQFYKELFNIDDREIFNMLKNYSQLLSLDINTTGETSVKSKIEFYKSCFNLTDRELIKIIKRQPTLLYLDIINKDSTSIRSKIDFYKNELDFSEVELKKAVIKSPHILCYDIALVKTKVQFYKQTFNLTEVEAKEMIRDNPTLLGLNVSTPNNTVEEKLAFYQQELGLTREKTCKLVKECLSLLEYETGFIKNKIKFYQQLLNLTNFEVAQMIKKMPGLLTYDTNTTGLTSIHNKIAVLSQFVSKEQIVNNPTLLGYPALRIKIRYLLLYQYDSNLFEGRKLMGAESTVYARIQHLKNLGKNITLAKLTTSCKRFEELYGKCDITQHALTEDVIHEIEKEYENFTGERLVLTSAELNAVLKANAVEQVDTLTKY